LCSARLFVEMERLRIKIGSESTSCSLLIRSRPEPKV